jgi:hypothetical protein
MFVRVAVSAQAAGAGMGMVGAYFGAKSQQDQLAFDAEMADLNARVSESTAQTALLAGQREVQKSRLSTANLKSTQRVGLAASGVALDEGSAVNVLTTTDYFGEVDANTIEANAVREAWGYRTQAANFKAQAISARGAAKAINPGAAVLTSFLGNAAKVGGDWYQMSKSGAFGGGAQPAGAAPVGGGLKAPKTGFWGN